MNPNQAWDRLISSPAAVLATIEPDGSPHLVPFVFAPLDFGVLVSAVDAKPKRSRELRRLANIRREPRVAVLAHHYEDDWERLWWVRGSGTAEIHEDPPPGAEALTARYPAYRSQGLGPWMVIRLSHLTGWDATGPPS